MNYTTLLFGFIWFSLAAATSIFPVYIQPVGSNSVYEKGVLTLDDRSATYEPANNAPSYTGPACVGIMNKNKKFQCFSFADILPVAFEKYIIYSTEHNGVQSIDHVDYVREPSTVDDSQVIVISERIRGPLPAFKKPIVMVNNQLPEPEVEKTFFQKYWIYMVPLAFMFLVSSSAPQ